MREAWSRLSWPQVVALGVMVAGAVALVVLVPEAKLAALPWEWLASLALIVTGGAASAALPPLVRSRPLPPVPPASPVERAMRGREEGSAGVEALAWVVLFAAACAVAVACSPGG